MPSPRRMVLGALRLLVEGAIESVSDDGQRWGRQLATVLERHAMLIRQKWGGTALWDVDRPRRRSLIPSAPPPRVVAAQMLWEGQLSQAEITLATGVERPIVLRLAAVVAEAKGAGKRTFPISSNGKVWNLPLAR